MDLKGGASLKSETGKISKEECIFLMVGFILGPAILILPGAKAAHQGWMAILLGLVEAMLFVYIYILLMRRLPGRTMVEILEFVFGPWVGKILAVVFLGYLFHVGAMGITSYHDYFKMSILVLTPSSVIIFAGIIVIIYGAVKGIEVLARCSQGMVIVTILLIFTLMLLSLPNLELTNLLPLFSIPIGKLLWSAHGAAIFPFGETVAFMMVIPSLNHPEQMKVVFGSALFIGGFFLMLIAATTTAVLGNAAEFFVYPFFQACRMIQIADIFTRLELIPAIHVLITVFLKTALLLYAVALGLAQVCKIKDYQPLVLPVGLLMALVSQFNFSSVLENLTFLNMIYPVYALVFQLILPLVTLIGTFIRVRSREA